VINDRDRKTNAADEPSLGRRSVLRGATTALLGGGAASFMTASSTANTTSPAAREKPTIIAQNGVATVETRSGKVAGYIRDGIFTFKGMPYAATGEGANRFMPPLKAAPWNGVRSSRQYGYVAPQGPRAGWANDEEAFMFSWDDGVQNEDCLHINVWTPAINDGKHRPVMVWLHGGGFSAGSGQELRSYDGENLARRGDVVVVSLNHRLNVLGHLDLSKYGDRYANSANVGMLDIVAALEWVRDNISGFGGDPHSVTIFGQSGGGGKVGTLMAMPSAKGLFHRAIVQSGSMLRAGTQEKSQQLADAIVAELGLSASTIDQIHQLPYQQLWKASDKVLRERNPRPPGGVPNFRRMADLLGFAPVVDGNILPAHPFDPRAPTLSADVPMIIGTTLNEFVTAINHPEFELMTESDLEQRVKGLFGDQWPAIPAAFRAPTPRAKPFDLWSRIAASSVRDNAVEQAAAKAALGRAPAYLYWFTWQTPVLNGRPRAFHCSEIAFVFDNTDRCENMTGGGPDARALAAKMTDAWIRFARTGDPNHPNLPRWPAFSTASVPTMMFDNAPTVLMNPDAAERSSIAGAAASK
jgi:para-nitrobenzyl esterase